VAWLRALTLCPGIGPGYAEKIYTAFINSGRDIMAFVRSHDITKVVPAKARNGYKRFSKIMMEITEPKNETTAGLIIRDVLDNGYETHILASFENAKDRLDDVHELINFSHEYPTVNEFLSDITLREGFAGETAADQADEEQLVLSTIHQSKGLEWDTVMLIGLCEGQFPHPKAMGSENEMEEERRLFYVAVTRARKYLYMIHPRSRYDYQKGTVLALRSRFLDELDSSDYEVWQVDSSSGFGYDEFSDRDEYDDVDDIDVIEL